MGKIHKLSPNLADMIAAGEVVERPASVVKELVENAVDAGATQITVEIKNGGVTFMRVTDNGCGMSAEDAPTAFLRHATSKISRPEDLGGIVTMGFRGEALAAISAVSKVDLLTKTADALEGTSVRAEAGNILDVRPAGCPDGTTIIVRDLFYNTPARMKFLKRDSVEGGYISAAVQRQALAHPEIAFRLIRDGKPELSTPGDGKLLSVIYGVMGRQTAREMVEVSGGSSGVSVRGYVGKPTANRGSRGYQHFFVNGRYVRSKTMSAALEEAYKNQMMVGRFPIGVLHITVAPTAVDVNVHPAKTEVRFLREGDVFDAIHYTVLGALSRSQDRPEMTIPQPRPAPAPTGDFYKTMTAEEYRAASTLNQQEQAAAKTFVSTVARRPQTVLRDSVRLAPTPTGPAPIPPSPRLEPETARRETPPPAQPAPRPDPGYAQTALDLPPAPEPQAPPAAAPQTIPQKPKEPPYRIIGEAMHTYIIVEQGETLLLFDKHAAHERILFEKLKAQDHEIMSQMLLRPIHTSLGREDAALLLEQTALLSRLGFTVEDYGDGDLLLRAIPAAIDPQDAEATLAQIAGELSAGKKPDPETVFDEMLHTVACKAAIKGGWNTDPQEIAALVKELMRRDDIQHCPHGRPVCIRLTRSNLERQFKRS